MFKVFVKGRLIGLVLFAIDLLQIEVPFMIGFNVFFTLVNEEGLII